MTGIGRKPPKSRSIPWIQTAGGKKVKVRSWVPDPARQNGPVKVIRSRLPGVPVGIPLPVDPPGMPDELSPPSSSGPGTVGAPDHSIPPSLS